MAEQNCVALPELLNSDVVMTATDSVAIARELAACAAEYEGGPFPSLDRVAICGDRVFLLHGDASSDARNGVEWVGGLLDSLLSHVEDAGGAVPVGLKILVTRATGHKFGEPQTRFQTGALPQLSRMSDLVQALDRFAPVDPSTTRRKLFERTRTGLIIVTDDDAQIRDDLGGEIAIVHDSPGQSPHEHSHLAPALLVTVVLAMFVFGAPIVRYFRPGFAASATTANAERSNRPPENPGTVQTDSHPQVDPSQTVRPDDVLQPPSPAAHGAAPSPPVAPATAPNVPMRPQIPTETPMALSATTGSDSTEPRAAAAERPESASPPTPRALAALREQRARLASVLADNEASLARNEGERHDVEMLLDNAQSDEDAAAFRKRLDELALRLDSLNEAKRRLEDGLRVLDRRLKPSGP